MRASGRCHHLTCVHAVCAQAKFYKVVVVSAPLGAREWSFALGALTLLCVDARFHLHYVKAEVRRGRFLVQRRLVRVCVVVRPWCVDVARVCGIVLFLCIAREGKRSILSS